MKKSTPSLVPLWTAALTALVGVVCQAAVSWSGTAAELHVASGQEKAVTEFAFRNSGPHPLRFTSLRPSCDCLTAVANKDSFAPGETGAVRVEFTVGGRVGRQEKFVTVLTDEPDAKPVQLMVVADIPEAVALRPRQLRWVRDALPTEQTVTITVAEADTTTRVEAQCADERFTATVEPGKSPGTYLLRVRPRETSSPTQSLVRLTVWLNAHPQVSIVELAVR